MFFRAGTGTFDMKSPTAYAGQLEAALLQQLHNLSPLGG